MALFLLAVAASPLLLAAASLFESSSSCKWLWQLLHSARPVQLLLCSSSCEGCSTIFPISLRPVRASLVDRYCCYCVPSSAWTSGKLVRISSTEQQGQSLLLRPEATIAFPSVSSREAMLHLDRFVIAAAVGWPTPMNQMAIVLFSVAVHAVHFCCCPSPLLRRSAPVAVTFKLFAPCTASSLLLLPETIA